MKYKIIVDKQPMSNPSEEKREYEVDIEELRYKGAIYDELIITKDDDYVVRRLSLSEYEVLTVLDEPVTEPLEDVDIELFEGDNYVYVKDMVGNRFYAKYIIRNDFTDSFVVYSEMFSAINQMADEINVGVSRKLEEYSKTTDVSAMINIKAGEIINRVSLVEAELKEQSISAVDVEYALGTSTTTAPTTGWSTTAPAWENGKYMWQRTVVTYGDGDTEISNVACISGAKGETGAKGDKGDPGTNGTNGTNGTDGDDGIGVSAIEEQYYLSTSSSTQTGGSWKTTQDEWSSGKYIWTRNKITWTDNTVTYTTPILATGLNKANTNASEAKNTANSTEAKLELKVNKADLISELNASADIIRLLAGRLLISSGNFQLDEYGNITCTGGTIGNFSINNTSLTKNISGIYNYNEFDKLLVALYVTEYIELTNTMQNILDTDNNGSVKVTDYARIARIIEGTLQNTKTASGTFEINASNVKKCLAIKDSLGNEVVSLGLGGINSEYIIGNQCIIGKAGNTYNDSTYVSMNGNTGDIEATGNGKIGCCVIDDKGIYTKHGSGTAGIGRYGERHALWAGGDIDTTNQAPFRVDHSGNLTALTVTQTSREEQKKNFEKLDNDTALQIVLDTDIYKYNMKKEEDQAKKHLGFVIGKNYKYSKEITTEEDGEEIGVDSYSMISAAYGAIQKLYKTIEEMQERIDVLENAQKQNKETGTN